MNDDDVSTLGAVFGWSVMHLFSGIS